MTVQVLVCGQGRILMKGRCVVFVLLNVLVFLPIGELCVIYWCRFRVVYIRTDEGGSNLLII